MCAFYIGYGLTSICLRVCYTYRGSGGPPVSSFEFLLEVLQTGSDSGNAQIRLLSTTAGPRR